jgi:hypothetical protein
MPEKLYPVQAQYKGHGTRCTEAGENPLLIELLTFYLMRLNPFKYG